MVQMLKQGPEINTNGKKAKPIRAQNVIIDKTTIGRTIRGENGKKLKRTLPKIGANGKYDKPTSALIW